MIVTKQCRTCAEHLPLERFYAAKSNRDGLKNQCKACMLKVYRQRYAADPEPSKQRARAHWHATDPEHRRREHRKRYLANRDRHLAKCREWSQKNRSKKRANDAAWRIANVDRKRQLDMAWRENNLDRAKANGRRNHLKRTFGITEEQYAAMLKAQGGVCAICASPDSGGSKPGAHFAVDHDHGTGRVRGLLCRACNTAIGLLKEDPATIRDAARYVQTGGTSAQQTQGDKAA